MSIILSNISELEMDLTTFEDHLEKYRGKTGTAERAEFDSKSLSFRLGVMLSEARKQANLTIDEVAKKTGTKTSYISKIETGESDIQLSTFIKLVELGLGKKLDIRIT